MRWGEGAYITYLHRAVGEGAAFLFLETCVLLEHRIVYTRTRKKSFSGTHTYTTYACWLAFCLFAGPVRTERYLGPGQGPWRPYKPALYACTSAPLLPSPSVFVETSDLDR